MATVRIGTLLNHLLITVNFSKFEGKSFWLTIIAWRNLQEILSMRFRDQTLLEVSTAILLGTKGLWTLGNTSTISRISSSGLTSLGSRQMPIKVGYLLGRFWEEGKFFIPSGPTLYESRKKSSMSRWYACLKDKKISGLCHRFLEY